jgi:Protein of unknown function (DUF3052)
VSDGGYSATPLWKKLGCKPGGRLLTRQAPPDWSVPDLPDSTRAATLGAGEPPGGPGDVVIAFFGSRSELSGGLAGLGEAIFPDGALWIAWPRRAAGRDSDIREQDIREEALPLGLVDVKVAALGEQWSGLRLVWRKERRRRPSRPA